MENIARLKLPYAPELDKAHDLKSFSNILEKAADASGAGKGVTDYVNWPETFPYRPECKFITGWCETGIGILFHVTGLDLRAKAMKNNDRTWEDSCCEFFVADTSDGTYYNFEMNCIGTLLVGKRKDRKDCIHFSDNQIEEIHQFSSLERREMNINDKEFSWSIGMFIPFELIGIDPKNMPTSIRANFYKCGDLTAHPHYLSWAPIDTPTPDFHRPEFFGILEFQQPKPVKKKNKWITHVLYPIMLGVYLGVVAFLCFGHFDSMSEVSNEFFGIPTDKIVHFSMFFPFPLLAYATFVHKKAGKWKSLMYIVIIYAAGCLLGGLTEIGQGLTDYRSCDINDFRADALGMALSSIIAAIIVSFRSSSK